MNYILFDGTVRTSLLPLTYTRPVADLRIGILTIRQKWEELLGFTTTTLTEEYLEEKYPMVEMEQNVMINASFLPTVELIEIIQNLKENQAVFKNEEVIAFFTTDSQEDINFDAYKQIEFDSEVLQIKNTWDLFSFNEEALKSDFDLITEGRKSQPIPEGVQYINKENIFIEEGAEILFSVLNASKGPIYIGKNALIMEGSLIRGPFAMLEHSVVKMGTKVYGATTLGPKCKIGGEVNNSILFG
ncbi:MAG: glucose-1-phosphate thymidylyltransferase, partial [Bacteroidetes bacterium]|nr:glucose-1-phosphate thymidylyltransferase [Bacteroidota bacterium]